LVVFVPGRLLKSRSKRTPLGLGKRKSQYGKVARLRPIFIAIGGVILILGQVLTFERFLQDYYSIVYQGLSLSSFGVVITIIGAAFLLDGFVENKPSAS
jgi:hypothetical protein